MDESS